MQRKLTHRKRTFAPATDSLEQILAELRFGKVELADMVMSKQEALAYCTKFNLGKEVAQYEVTVSIEKVKPRKTRTDKKKRTKKATRDNYKHTVMEEAVNPKIDYDFYGKDTPM